MTPDAKTSTVPVATQTRRLLIAAGYGLFIAESAMLALALRTLWACVIGAAMCGLHAGATHVWRRLVLPGWMVAVLAPGGVAAVAVSVRPSPAGVLAGAAVFLFAMQYVLFFRRYAPREQRAVQIAALLILMACTARTSSEAYLPLFIVFVAAFCFHLFALEYDRIGSMAAVPLDGLEHANLRVPALRVLVKAVVFIVNTLLILTAMLFLLFPRFKSDMQAGLYDFAPLPEIGYREEMKLGQMVRLLDNNDPVMIIGLSSRDRARVGQAMSEPLIRGATLDYYRGGRWYDYGCTEVTGLQSVTEDVMPSSGGWTSMPGAAGASPMEGAAPWVSVEQQVWLEPMDSTTLFSIGPPKRIWLPSGTAFRYDRLSETLTVQGVRGLRLRYRISSLILPDREREILRDAVWPFAPGLYTQVPDSLKLPLQHYLDGVPEYREAKTDLARVRAIETHLSNTGGFGYTTRLPSMGRGDPVLGFLTGPKAGHCEYFASAMCLLCRASGIPARLVIGFKGGDWDAHTRAFTIRQRHAHAWVEVRLARLGWVWFDPTSRRPAPTGAEVRTKWDIGQGSYGWFSDLLRVTWLTKIIGYDREKQKEFLVACVRTLHYAVENTRVNIMRMIPRRLNFYRLMLPAFVAAVLGGTALIYFLIGRLERILLIRRPTRYHQRATLRFYMQVLKILGDKGLHRKAHWTPLEYFERLAEVVGGDSERARSVRDSLRFATDLYYDVRFGLRHMTEADLAQSRQVLKVLERWRPQRDSGIDRKALDGFWRG